MTQLNFNLYKKMCYQKDNRVMRAI